ncbi:MAG TPA: YgeY family selenium metabolism-linked hydrolase, partial [Dermatophilaceae bacterium]
MTTTAQIDFAKVKEAAEGYRADMSRFLRALIKAKGMSCQEEEKSKLIQKEMVKLGYTKAEIDPLGNVLGYMGTGETLIAFDGHIDTVGVGNIENWTFDPF